jgi:hypothetical protein
MSLRFRRQTVDELSEAAGIRLPRDAQLRCRPVFEENLAGLSEEVDRRRQKDCANGPH